MDSYSSKVATLHYMTKIDSASDAAQFFSKSVAING